VSLVEDGLGVFPTRASLYIQPCLRTGSGSRTRVFLSLLYGPATRPCQEPPLTQRPLPSTPPHVPASKPDAAERDLVARIQAGDSAAFSTLFSEHFAALCGFVVSFVHEPAIAEELVQDLFTALWHRRAEWEPTGRVRHYLIAAARNRALSHLRHASMADRKSRSWTGPAGEGDELPGMGAGVEPTDRGVELGELADACREAIHRLPERRRMVVTMRWQHQMTHAEIAHALGISVKGVEGQLTLALKSLRKQLGRFRE
jgi:RNA polymerase sigma-70 factor (ECF subfamily)